MSTVMSKMRASNDFLNSLPDSYLLTDFIPSKLDNRGTVNGAVGPVAKPTGDHFGENRVAVEDRNSVYRKCFASAKVNKMEFIDFERKPAGVGNFIRWELRRPKHVWEIFGKGMLFCWMI